MHDVVVESLVCCATIALMVGFAIHNRRTGWRHPRLDQGSRQVTGVWLLARQLDQLKLANPHVSAPFPPASVSVSLANLHGQLTAATQALDAGRPEDGQPSQASLRRMSPSVSSTR